MLTFTIDGDWKYPSKFIPMLDLQVWSQYSKEGSHCLLRHSFYQKDITSPLVFHTDGAYGMKPKIVTMSEEFRRRLLHMNVHHTTEDRKEIPGHFIQKMADSGYKHSTRKEVIKSASTKY